MSAPIGKFVWYEYMGDRKPAADFYAHVVGWGVKDAGMGGFPYDIVSVGDHMVGGIMDMPEEAKAMGARPGWMSYISVEDVDDSAKRLTAARGRVFKEPADIAGVGRFAVVADPYGGAFMLFRDAGGNPPPPPVPGTPGTIGWHELHSDDGAKALAFYSDFFGWKKERDFDMGPIGVYHTFDTGHGQHGGVMTRTKEMPASLWLYYIYVESIDAAAERTGSKGGRIANGPLETPNGRWIVQALDPQGAMFALVAPKR
jgi:predicted enzyme related to lactoylglutathione lyase